MRERDPSLKSEVLWAKEWHKHHFSLALLENEEVV